VASTDVAYAIRKGKFGWNLMGTGDWIHWCSQGLELTVQQSTKSLIIDRLLSRAW